MISLERAERRVHRSIPEVRALRPGVDAWIGARLDWLASRGAIPVHGAKVNRTHVYGQARIAYLSAKYLNVGAEHFERHDRLLAETGVSDRKWDGLPERITAFLDRHLAAGTLVRKKKGHGVCRTWISNELRFPIWLFVVDRHILASVQAFNTALPRVDLQETGKHRDLHLTIAEFLREGWAAGTLKIGPDGVDKTWLARQLGFKSPVYTRYPNTKKAVDAFNASIRGEIAPSPTYPTLAIDLRALIGSLEANEGLPVAKDRLNETELARCLGVRQSAFRLVPECGAVLAAANERVRFGDPARPFHEGHERNYSFRDLIPAFGAAGAARIAKRFCDVAGPSAGAGKSQYRLVLAAFISLGASLPKKAVRALSTGSAVEDRLFEGALRKWRSEHLAQKREPHVISREIVTARATLERMALLGEAVEVLVPLANAGAARPKASLAEAKVRCGERVAGVVSTYAESKALDYDRQEVEAFVTNLALSSELEDIAVEDLPEAIRKLNRERLDRIASCAHVAFQEGYERHAKGLALLATGREQAAALDRVLRAIGQREGTRADLMRFFTERGEDGLAAYLHYVDREHGGRLPRSTKAGSIADNVYYAKITRGLGGIDALVGLLHPCERTVAAACIIYIVEAGANGAVARGLLTDCLRASNVPGHREVSGWKDRSGRPIVTDLPEDHRDGSSSAVRVLEALLELQPRLARLAAGPDGRHLFLADTVGRVKPIAEHRLLELLRTIAKSDPALADFELRVDMIRSSVLLDAALSADGNINVATALANHTDEGMTAHYVVKMPLRIIYERKIRHFQEALASIALIGIEGAAERLGLPVDRVRSLAERAMRTGLGRLCLMPAAGIQPDTVKGETCTKVQACGRCASAVIVADVEIVADLVIWHQSLVEAAETWPPERTERFEEAWLDELAFCDAALDALKRGPHARILKRARETAERRLADPNYERPRPW